MSDFLADLAIGAYRWAGVIATPFAGLLLAVRARAGKEDPTRRGERVGFASRPRPAGKVIWMHAASNGETMSVLPLIDWLTGADYQVVLTTGTKTSATLAAARLSKGAVHQYVPLDLPKFVNRFLDHWQPEAALFVESEVWPTIVSELKRRGIAQALVNARLSERSRRRWLKAARLARVIFRSYALVLAQSQSDANRFRDVGVARPFVTGNIKFDSRTLTIDADERDRLLQLIGQRPVLLAASTHDGEEAIVAEAARRIVGTLPDLLTIIVPRHPNRSAQIGKALVESGAKVARRSEGGDPTPDTTLYIADTLGELGLFYSLAPVAFIGGTLVPVGGHNPIEAAQLHTALLHGPHIENARDIFDVLDAGGGAELVGSIEALAAAALRLLTVPSEATAMATAGADIVRTGRGALDRTRAYLIEHILRDMQTGAADAAVAMHGQARA